MTPRSITPRTLALTVGALVVLFAGWSYRESIGELFKRPVAATSAPVVNVPAPIANVTVEPEIALKWEPNWIDTTHEYLIDGKRAFNVTEFPFMVYRYNDLETGKWRTRRANEVERVGLLEGVKRAEKTE